MEAAGVGMNEQYWGDDGGDGEEIVCIVVDISPEVYARAAEWMDRHYSKDVEEIAPAKQVEESLLNDYFSRNIFIAASFEEVVSTVMMFLRVLTTTTLISGPEKVMVLGMMAGRYVTLYDPYIDPLRRNYTSEEDTDMDDDPLAADHQIHDVASEFQYNLLRVLEEYQSNSSSTSQNTSSLKQNHPVALSQALARCLCWIHRSRGGVAAAAALGQQNSASSSSKHQTDDGSLAAARILVLLSSPDPVDQYVDMMNVIFASQSAKVMIDGIALCRPIPSAAGHGPGHKQPLRPLQAQSEYLQQICFMTQGCYIQPMRGDALANYCKLSLLLGSAERQRYTEMGSSITKIGNKVCANIPCDVLGQSF